MSRMLIIFISVVIFLLPAPVYAGDEGGSRKSEVISLYNSYRASLKAGDSKQALKFAQQMYALTHEVYGEMSKTHATATFNLAQMNDFLKSYQGASQYYQEYIDILDELKTPKDKRYLVKLGLLSADYMKIDKIDEAITYGKKALELAKDLKVSDKMLAKYELELGAYYYLSYSQGRKARRHIDRAVDLLTQVYGENDARTASAIFWQAKLDMSPEKNRRAAEEFEHVLDIYNKELKVGDDRILQIHAFLVGIYEKMGEKDKSTEHCIAVATERSTDFDRDLNPLYKVRTYASCS